MELLEKIVFWSTVFLYVLSFIVHIWALARNSEHGTRNAMILLLLGLAGNTAVLAIRWFRAGHPPVVDPYELQASAAWFTVVIFFLLNRANMIDRTLSLLLAPIAFLLLGNAYASEAEITEMGSLYATPWMIVHVGFAWISFGSYALAAAAAIIILLHDKISSRLPDRLPDVERLDLECYRLIVIGVVNQTIMLASGAIWAKRAWGHYWSWTPLEAWSLLSYLLYVFYLHLRRFRGWKMKRTAWIAAFGLVILSISFWGIRWFGPTLHPGP